MAKQPVEDTKKKLDAIVKAVRKELGEESISLLGHYEPCKSFPTGFPTFDAITGVGGFPLAKLVEVAGPESTGKSTFMRHIIGRAQKAGVIPYFLDSEHSGASEWDEKLGVDTSRLLGSDPETLEDAFTMMIQAIEELSKMGAPGLIVLDSIAALPLKDELERGMEEGGRLAERAAFLSRKLPVLVHALKSTDIGIVFVNQIRDNPGAAPFQPKTYSPGGRALRHWVHLKLETTRMQQIKGSMKKGQSGEVIGIKTRVRVTKNKLGPPFKAAHFNLTFDGTLAEDPDA